MNNTAPIWQGIAAIAGLVFIIATGVALVMYEFNLNASVFVGVIASGIAAVALFVGWAPPRHDKPVKPAAHATPVATQTPAASPAPAAKPTSVTTPAPAATPTPAASPAPVTTPEPVAVVTETPAPVATPDPVAAPQDPAGKPVFLTAARDGGPDDLKLIKGVGPKLETMLHEMGVYHFDQIASWGPAEQAWMDDNLEGFKGRVTRDEWVAQARTLASGGTV